MPNMDSKPILSICFCVTINVMLNFDSDFDIDANTDVKREQGKI